MAKNPAPLDVAVIERATRFDASIFLGTGKYHTGSFDNLADAREAARQFGEVAKNGRKGMVYAITAEGRSVFVPDDYTPAAKGLIDMTATNLSGTEIAKLTAIVTGGGYKRANSRDAAEARFRKVAGEAGIPEASINEYLAGPFDMAEHCVRERIEGRAMTILEVQAMREPEPAAIDISDLATSDHPAAKANEASWDAIPSIARGRSRKAALAVAEAAAPAEAPKPAKAPKKPKAKEPGKRAAILAAAERGELPAAPDFSAETHKRFRPKLAQVVALAEAGDVAGLEAFEINPVSSSPKAIAKYRDLAVIALKARADKGAAA